MGVGEVTDFRAAQRAAKNTERINPAAEQGVARPLAFTEVIVFRQDLPRTNREAGIGANGIAIQVKQAFRAVERDGNVAPRTGRHGGGRINLLLATGAIRSERKSVV